MEGMAKQKIEIQKLDNMKKKNKLSLITSGFRGVCSGKVPIFVRSLLKEIPQFCGEKTEMN